MPADADSARTLVTVQLAGTRYLARTIEMLDAALQFDDPEFLAVVAERREQLVGVALFGTVAGARQCTKCHALLGPDPEAVAALAAAMVRVCSEAGERLVVAEFADDVPFVTGMQALTRAGFALEGRIDDYVADGVALQLLVWRRTAAGLR